MVTYLEPHHGLEAGMTFVEDPGHADADRVHAGGEVGLVACVENNHWFGSAQAALKLVYLAKNEVLSAHSWTGDHLYARSRGLADPSRRIRSNWTMLNVS